jgi:hypothetical protein
LWLRPVEDGTVIAEIYPPTPRPKVDVYRNLTLQITIQETATTPTMVFPNVVEAMRGAVREAVRRLGPSSNPTGVIGGTSPSKG